MALRNIRHDPVQREIYVTSKHRSLGGVEWFREAQFSKDGAQTSQQLNTWAVLANVSKATAPAAVDRPKRHTIIPDFSKMHSHEDIMNEHIRKSVDDRPPLNPIYNDKFKAPVKMTKPPKSAEMIERERREQKHAEALKRKEQNAEFGVAWKSRQRQQHHDDDNDGDDDPFGDHHQGGSGKGDFHYVIEEVTDANGNIVKRKVKKRGAKKKDPHSKNGEGSGRESPLLFLLKARPDPKSIKSPLLNAAERFPDLAKIEKNNNKNKKKRLRNERAKKRGMMMSDGTTRRDPDRLSDFLGDEHDEERSRAMKKEFETITLKFEGDEEEERKRRKKEASAAKFIEYDYDKDPNGVGRIVDFSSKPFAAAPSWSFGTPPAGETAVQRKKRQEEEIRAAEAEYAYNAKIEKQNRLQQALLMEQERRNNINNNTSFVVSNHGNDSSMISTPGKRLLGAAIDFSRGSSRQTGSERRTSRKDQFLDLFKTRDAKMHGPGSPFFHHTRTRTPEINSGCLLGSGGTNNATGLASASGNNNNNSGGAASSVLFAAELAQNAEASLIRSNHTRKLYKAHAKDLVRRVMSSTPENLMSSKRKNNNNNNNNNVSSFSSSNYNNTSQQFSAAAKEEWQSLARRSPAYNLILNASYSQSNPSSSLNASQQQHQQIQHSFSFSGTSKSPSASTMTKPPLPEKRLHFSATPQNRYVGQDENDDDDEEED